MAEFDPIGIGGLSSRPVTRRSETKTRARKYERSELLPPPRAPRNFVPDDDLISSLVERAVAALARGIYWDRGSIINLVL